MTFLRHVPEIIEPVFTKTSQYARFLLSENERFGLVFVKTGSINSGNGQFTCYMKSNLKMNRLYTLALQGQGWSWDASSGNYITQLREYTTQLRVHKTTEE
jgi:hypothetical protein